MDTDDGYESQAQEGIYDEHLFNKAITDFVKGYGELFDKNNEHFKDKVRKE